MSTCSAALIPRAPKWTLGVGTAITLWIGHRVSHGINIFVPGTRLKGFTPAVTAFLRAEG